MRFTLVAGDFAQSEVLSALGDRLVSFGDKVTKFLAYGKPGIFRIADILQAIHFSNQVVVGMSELNREEVYAAKKARELGKPCAFYADTFGTYRLPAFEKVRNCASALFVASIIDATRAPELFPKKTRIVVTGNPRWESFFQPKLLKEEARKKFRIPLSSSVVLCAGNKYLDMNMSMFEATIEAASRIPRQIFVIIALHPGDQNDPAVYQHLAQRKNVSIIGMHMGVSTPDILMGCDVVVHFTSPIGIQAMCLRIPVIDWCSTAALKHMAGGRPPVIGKDPWYPTEVGASWPVYHDSVAGLETALSKVLLPGESELMAKRQIELFPEVGGQGRAIMEMVETLSMSSYKEQRW